MECVCVCVCGECVYTCVCTEEEEEEAVGEGKVGLGDVHMYHMPVCVIITPLHSRPSLTGQLH